MAVFSIMFAFVVSCFNLTELDVFNVFALIVTFSKVIELSASFLAILHGLCHFKTLLN